MTSQKVRLCVFFTPSAVCVTNALVPFLPAPLPPPCMPKLLRGPLLRSQSPAASALRRRNLSSPVSTLVFALQSPSARCDASMTAKTFVPLFPSASLSSPLTFSSPFYYRRHWLGGVSSFIPPSPFAPALASFIPPSPFAPALASTPKLLIFFQLSSTFSSLPLPAQTSATCGNLIRRLIHSQSFVVAAVPHPLPSSHDVSRNLGLLHPQTSGACTSLPRSSFSSSSSLASSSSASSSLPSSSSTSSSTPFHPPSSSSHPSSSSFSSKKLRHAISTNPFCKLIKLELTALVVITTAGGYFLTGGSFLDPAFWGVEVGTFLCAASASTWNQLSEVEFDAQMTRTMRRPLVTGEISMSQARVLRAVTGFGGCAVLLLTTSHITAALGAATILLYACVYTPLKRRTRFNTEVGAVVGAIPPVMGWTAVSGLDALMHMEAVYLASYLFVWQMSHFMVINWRRRDEYRRADFRMASRDDSTGKTVAYGYAWALASLPFPVVSTVMGFTSPSFIVLGTLPHLYLLYHYRNFYLATKAAPLVHNDAAALRAFKAGFISLVAFGALMVLCMMLQDLGKVGSFTELVYSKGHDLCLFFYHMDVFKRLRGEEIREGSKGNRSSAVGAYLPPPSSPAALSSTESAAELALREQSLLERLFCVASAKPVSKSKLPPHPPSPSLPS